ncbi:hypothetical protein E2C01_064580 [Portunus trituberculatus]|uniref:Uncharacterized protein n=1 Tax=Portunus trituberculatus TaxID=210409 RepID=A0A5B7HK54_PORTR|nr:hypothetical protein [Portunus trituberculatus]
MPRQHTPTPHPRFPHLTPSSSHLTSQPFDKYLEYSFRSPPTSHPLSTSPLSLSLSRAPSFTST